MSLIQSHSISLPTNREVQILSALAEGKSAKEIALELNLSAHTINTHKQNLFIKLNARNTVELVVKAVRNGIVAINEFQQDVVVKA